MQSTEDGTGRMLSTEDCPGRMMLSTEDSTGRMMLSTEDSTGRMMLSTEDSTGRMRLSTKTMKTPMRGCYLLKTGLVKKNKVARKCMVVCTQVIKLITK